MSNDIQATDEKKVSKFDEFRHLMTGQKDKFLKVLPAHVSFEKFQAVVMTALIMNPSLLTANRASLLQSSIKSATDGLLPDGREAAFVTFKTKEKFIDDAGKEQERWIEKVQFLPMYMGIQKRVRQSGEVSSINTQVVYQKDTFKWNPATLEITHEVYEGEDDRGQVRAAYCVVVMKDGGVQKEVMYRNDIEAIRKRSKAGAMTENDVKYSKVKGVKVGDPKGIWASDYPEMARKTVFRRASKWLPQSVDKAGNVINHFEGDDSIGLLSDFSEDAPSLTGPDGQGAIEDKSEDSETAGQPDLKQKIEEKKAEENPDQKQPEPENKTVFREQKAPPIVTEILTKIKEAKTLADLDQLWNVEYEVNLKAIEKDPAPFYAELMDAAQKRRQELSGKML